MAGTADIGPPGAIVVVPRPEPKTLLELADRAVEDARVKLEIAAVEYAGALQRRQMVLAAGKS